MRQRGNQNEPSQHADHQLFPEGDDFSSGLSHGDASRPGGAGRSGPDSAESGEKYSRWALRRRYLFGGILLSCVALSMGSLWAWKSNPRSGGAPQGRGSEGAGGRVGVSTGNYSLLAGGLCDTCGERISHYCGFDVNGPMPPEELLIPGMLSDRHELSLAAQCFLWYAKAFWTRATGGAQGVTHYRHGGMDDRAELVRKVEAYERAAGCAPFQVLPPTLDLGDPETCLTFHQDNGRWDPPSAPRSSSGEMSSRDQHRLWFIKDSDGSTGNHIRLVRGTEVCASRARTACPLTGTVASLGVQEPLLLDLLGGAAPAGAESIEPAVPRSDEPGTAPQHGTPSERGNPQQERGTELFKFDLRAYVLVASIRPLVVLFHPGHLRLSAIPFSDKAAGGRGQAFSGGGAETARGEDARGLGRACQVGAEGAWNRSGRSHTELAMHITNPQFGLRHTRDASRILQPVSRVRAVLVQRHGRADGMKRWAKVEESARKAVLHVVFAVRSMWAGKGAASKWGHALLAIDVMLDGDMRAKVLDVNSMPSFYHRSMSGASVQESDASALRGVASRKLLQQAQSARRAAPASAEETREPSRLWNGLRRMANGVAAALGHATAAASQGQAGASAFLPSREEWPAWFLDHRSRVIRGAVDAVQEVAWRKMQDTIAHSKRTPAARDRAKRRGEGGRLAAASKPSDAESEDASGDQPAWDRVGQGVRGLGRGGWETIYSEVLSGSPRNGSGAVWAHYPNQCVS